jgi:hypothetical protein
MLHRDGVTQGLLQRFLGCPERHRLTMNEGLTTGRGSGALAFGNIVHNALDRVYTYQKDTGYRAAVKGVLDLMYERDMEKFRLFPPSDPNAQQDLEDNYALAEPVLEAYFEHWEEDLSRYKWLALERKFSVNYSARQRLQREIEDIPLRGKRDGDLRIGKGLWLFETKTKGQVEEDNIIDMIPLDLQVNLYLLSQSVEYAEIPQGVVYNIIRRPQLRRRKTESMQQFAERVRLDIAERPGFYFMRYEVSISPSEQERWLLEFDGIMRTIIDWSEGKFHFRNSATCLGKFGACEFLKICSRGDRTGFQVREKLFPELEDEEE